MTCKPGGMQKQQDNKQKLNGVALGRMHNMQMIAKIINNSHKFYFNTSQEVELQNC